MDKIKNPCIHMGFCLVRKKRLELSQDKLPLEPVSYTHLDVYKRQAGMFLLGVTWDVMFIAANFPTFERK